jgi:hypothetical protein
LAIDGCLLDMPWVDELKMEYGGKSNKNGEIEAIKAKFTIKIIYIIF